MITLEHACSSDELGAIKELDERFENAGPEADTREYLTAGSLLLGEIPGGVVLSLLGRAEGREVCYTVIGPTVWSVCECMGNTVCKIFKVDDAPF